MSTRTAFVDKEITIIEEIINILAKPNKYGISDKEMFTVLNSSSSMLDNIINGPKLSESPSNNVSTKMIDFKNLVALGQLLADKRNIINTSSSTNPNKNVDDMNNAVRVLKTIYQTLSTNVYINHVKTPSVSAAVSASAAASGSTSTSWWNINKANLQLTNSTDGSIISSTNPLESVDYFPDLRLVLKNVLVLFISFLKRYQDLINSIKELSENDKSLIVALRDLMLLLNVSILNKLVEIFKMLNPKLSLKSERTMFDVFK
ncbi:hypothetical protein DAPK24_039660 [Pichia kluyveri]|uniref:Uncharacterized protein n=1 Tax=Pichia kluyveri TaxID=36015 RepID=A0AAV5R7Z9_PICKL|nr:hypothetical protein DAPK24_039660 [Pichia kluyveri]